jgi:hypothetical protein
MAYTAESESPDEYHVWTALSTIAGAIRRKAFFNMGYFLLYPNLYIVLVGPPGRCKKSTAMRIGRRMLSQIPDLYFSVDSTTRERLILDITQSLRDGHSSMTAYSSEFASLLTSSGMDMVVFLTDIYDSPDEWSHKTKMGGTNKIKAPYLNLEGATTPDWIARSLPLDTVGIGLTARILFVYQDTPRVRKPFPELSKEQIELEAILVRDLQHIALISGQFVLEAQAKKFYEDWYVAQHQGDRPIVDPRLSGYVERKPMHLLKVAMLMSASKKNDTVLTQSDIERALAFLEHIEPAMAKTFASVGKNPLTADITQAGSLVLGKPGVDYATLLKTFSHNVRKDELDDVMNTLSMMGYVKAVQGADGVRYYPTESAKEELS